MADSTRDTHTAAVDALARLDRYRARKTRADAAIRAVLDALGWEDDRHNAPSDVPVGALWNAAADVVDAVRAVLEPSAALAARYWAGYNAGRADAAHDTEHLAATLRDVLATFTRNGHPGEPCVKTHWIPARRVDEWRAALARTTREDTDR